jgi:hypothetical protein
MTLVNLTGTAIFGAGSEWFWSMAQFLLVAASILGIYFQLRAQRSSNLHDQSAAWNREWNDELFMVHRLAALYDLEGRPIEAGLPLSAANVGDFFDRIGYLIGQRHLRSADMWHTMRFQIGFWWLAMQPYLMVTRQDSKDVYEWFEKLELEMQRIDVKVYGKALDASRFTVRQAADDIARQLHLIADARNGIYPTPHPTPDPSAAA